MAKDKFSHEGFERFDDTIFHFIKSSAMTLKPLPSIFSFYKEIEEIQKLNEIGTPCTVLKKNITLSFFNNALVELSIALYYFQNNF